MTDTMQRSLDRLSRVRGVSGSMFVAAAARTRRGLHGGARHGARRT